METLDELCAKCKHLREEEFNILLSALRQEEERRKNAERNEDWKTVCQVIDMFTRKWGSLYIQENANPLVIEGINLLPGNYTTPEFGVIEVGA